MQPGLYHFSGVSLVTLYDMDEFYFVGVSSVELFNSLFGLTEIPIL